MKLIKEGRFARPLEMTVGQWTCTFCYTVFEVESEEDITSLCPQTSWAGTDAFNTVPRFVCILCPYCNQRTHARKAKDTYDNLTPEQKERLYSE